jgi:hypothetical protein
MQCVNWLSEQIIFGSNTELNFSSLIEETICGGGLNHSYRETLTLVLFPTRFCFIYLATDEIVVICLHSLTLIQEQPITQLLMLTGRGGFACG